MNNYEYPEDNALVYNINNDLRITYKILGEKSYYKKIDDELYINSEIILEFTLINGELMTTVINPKISFKGKTTKLSKIRSNFANKELDVNKNNYEFGYLNHNMQKIQNEKFTLLTYIDSILVSESEGVYKIESITGNTWIYSFIDEYKSDNTYSTKEYTKVSKIKLQESNHPYYHMQ